MPETTEEKYAFTVQDVEQHEAMEQGLATGFFDDGWREKKEGDNVDNEYPGISGEELAGQVPGAQAYIAGIVELMLRTDPKEYTLSDLDSFEQVLVGVFIRKLHLMIEKQKGYGKSNITKSGLRGLLTRATDKIERAKNIIGDPDETIDNIKAMLAALPDDATAEEQAIALSHISKAVNPETFAEESIEDTVMDLGNYGDIMYIVQMNSWGKDMETA